MLKYEQFLSHAFYVAHIEKGKIINVTLVCETSALSKSCAPWAKHVYTFYLLSSIRRHALNISVITNTNIYNLSVNKWLRESTEFAKVIRINGGYLSSVFHSHLHFWPIVFVVIFDTNVDFFCSRWVNPYNSIAVYLYVSNGKYNFIF